MINFRSLPTIPNQFSDDSGISRQATGTASQTSRTAGNAPQALLGKIGLGGSFSQVLAQLKETANEIERSKKMALEKVYELAQDNALASKANNKKKNPPEPAIVGKNGTLTDVPLLPALETLAGKEIRKQKLDKALDKESPPNCPQEIRHIAIENERVLTTTRLTLDALGDRLRMVRSQKSGMDTESWWQNIGNVSNDKDKLDNPQLDEALQYILASLEKNKAASR